MRTRWWVLGAVAGLLLMAGLLVLVLGFSSPGKSSVIAVLPVNGTLSSSMDSFNRFSSRELAEQLKDLSENPQYAAIVLDIDSGGGEIVASKEIAYAVREAGKQKPVVA
ncbi:MAG: hypothetical protein HY917_03895, partial [Candidatus Diapherotrites archaeon]|nr:hypothetical protein [Candidatus Diapherotrites archaeon]